MSDPVTAAPASAPVTAEAPVSAPIVAAAPAPVEVAAQPVADTAKAETPTEAEKPQASVAPEKYDFSHLQDKTDPAVLTKFEATAKEIGLSQAQANKLIEDIAPQITNAHQAQIATAVAAWAEDAKKDPEIGGAKFEENLGIAKKALDTFGTPALTKLLNDSGLGNHPEVIRAFLKAGQKISPGSFVSAGGGNAKPVDHAKSLYPNMN